MSMFVLALMGCQKSEVPILWDKEGDLSDAVQVVLTSDDGLAGPTDLAFNPIAPEQLWIVNREEDSVVILEGGDSSRFVDPYALHFMEQVTSISFDPNGLFGTCQDGRNTYNGNGDPNDFTGPTLWTSDPAVFAETNPEAVDYLGFDLGSHLDMLHESPQCMGIAWERDNVYWVFDGFNGDIVRYDFAEDHGPGFDDHCDGDIQRWGGSGISRVAGVVSHLVFDHATSTLYIADTGNGRVLALDTTTGERGRDLSSIEGAACRGLGYDEGPAHYRWRDGEFRVLIEGLDQPSGLELIDGYLFVVEHGTGEVGAYDLEGMLIEKSSTGRAESLQGITGSLDELWIVDGTNDELLRLANDKD